MEEELAVLFLALVVLAEGDLGGKIDGHGE